MLYSPGCFAGEIILGLAKDLAEICSELTILKFHGPLEDYDVSCLIDQAIIRSKLQTLDSISFARRQPNSPSVARHALFDCGQHGRHLGRSVSSYWDRWLGFHIMEGSSRRPGHSQPHWGEATGRETTRLTKRPERVHNISNACVLLIVDEMRKKSKGY